MLPHADHALALRDTALPGLATVLDAAASARLVAQLLPDAPAGAPVVSYTRYKPAASCLTALRYPGTSGEVFITLKAVSIDATEKWGKYANDPDAVQDAALRIVLRRFPADAVLAGPRWLFDADRHAKVRRQLGLPNGATFDVIAYKPERRLVVAAGDAAGAVAAVKCYDAGSYATALRAHRALATAPQLAVRSATAWSDRRSTIATPWIAGRILNIASDPLHVFVLAGEALAAVHNAHLDVRTGESDTAAHTGLHRIAHAVTQWSPASRAAWHRCLDRLAQHRSDGTAAVVPIHGDFYTKQILVGPDGISLLDFDECCIADPHLDLALFTAHLERDLLRDAYSRDRLDAVRDALLEGYRHSRPVNESRLAWRTAEALLRLSPHPFRHRDPNWPELTAQLIARADELLDAVPPPHRAHGVRPQVESTAAVTADAWRALNDDTELRFVCGLREADESTRTLAFRSECGTASPVVVAQTAVLRHKAGRRCLIAFDVHADGLPARWLGKVRARGTDIRAARIHRLLWDAGARCIPEPLGVVHSARMTLQREAPGVPLLRAFADGVSPVALGLTVARALHSLQHLTVPIPRRWSVSDELRVLEVRATALRERYPMHAAQLTAVYGALELLASPLHLRTVQTIVHRDFYHDQVLVHGRDCTLVDLDLVATGDPALDPGNFIAHLRELAWRNRLDDATALACIDAFTAEAIRLAPHAVTHDAITRYELLSLGRLIEIAARHADRAKFVAQHLETLAERVSLFTPPVACTPTGGVSLWSTD